MGLIQLALLLGSDYTEGIHGIGIVNAVEVVHAFPGESGLEAFRKWVLSPDEQLLALARVETTGGLPPCLPTTCHMPPLGLLYNQPVSSCRSAESSS